MEDLDIRMAGGADELRLYRAYGSGVIRGGKDGSRVLKLLDYSKSVMVDLDDGLMELDGLGEYRISGFHRVVATAPRVRLHGDRRGNGLVAGGCRAKIEGGRGADVVQAYPLFGMDCEPRGARLIGQKGDDRLIGTSENDVLIGGPGSDKADGAQGRDRCEAEKKKRCER